MKFTLNKSKSDTVFNIYEYEIKNWRLTIIEDKVRKTFWVYVKREVYEWNDYLWYMEISNNKVANLKECKQVAEKMLDIVNGYKPPLPN